MLKLDASLLVVFALVWILLLVLKKVFFKPMESIRAERQDIINTNKEAFSRAQEKHERVLLDIEAKIKKVRTEAQTARDRTEEQALKEKERLVRAVSEESKGQVEKAKAELESKMKGLLDELAGKSEDLAKSIEQRLLH